MIAAAAGIDRWELVGRADRADRDLYQAAVLEGVAELNCRTPSPGNTVATPTVAQMG